MKFNVKLSRELSILVLSAACGGIAGGIVARLVSPVEPSVQPSVAPTSTRPVAPTSTAPVISLVPIERSSAGLLLPPDALTRRASGLGLLYRKMRGTSLDDRLLGNERLLGRVVALTADGWFVTTAGALENLRPTDLTIWQNGVASPVEKGFADRLNGTVFLKTAVHGLTASAFVQSSEAVNGTGAWLETRPGGFNPLVLVDAGGRVSPNESASSEIAVRRFFLNRVSQAGERGSAVWDPSGALLGIVESREGEETRVVPAATIATSLASLLESGAIRHPVLGIRALDLAVARIDGSRNGLPDRGALVHDDRRSGKPGVKPDSPAARASLKTGDVISRVERDILDGRADLGELLAEYKPGATVTLRVLRDGKDLDVPVTLGSAVTGDLLK